MQLGNIGGRADGVTYQRVRLRIRLCYTRGEPGWIGRRAGKCLYTKQMLVVWNQELVLPTNLALVGPVEV